jgi:hypothetical protein
MKTFNNAIRIYLFIFRFGCISFKFLLNEEDFFYFDGYFGHFWRFLLVFKQKIG